MSLLNADGRKMRYNNLGGTGLMVSEISFGSAFDEALLIMQAAFVVEIPRCSETRALCLQP